MRKIVETTKKCDAFEEGLSSGAVPSLLPGTFQVPKRTREDNIERVVGMCGHALFDRCSHVGSFATQKVDGQTRQVWDRLSPTPRKFPLRAKPTFHLSTSTTPLDDPTTRVSRGRTEEMQREQVWPIPALKQSSR